MRVLVAEDDLIAANVLCASLEKWGYEAVHIADGAEAWQAYDSDPAPIVISDWMMPGLDGPDLVRKIRAKADGQYTYTVLLTSRSETSDVVSGLDAGADDYLKKPVDLEELRARLRTAKRIVTLERDLAQRNEDLGRMHDEVSNANSRMREDLEAAAVVQRALLPVLVSRFEHAEFAWRFQPCEELAGDTLNVVKLTDRYAAFYLLDVSGHGVPAALSSVTLSRVLVPAREQSTLLVRMVEGEPQVVPPAVMVRRLNRRFASGMTGGQFFTLIYGVLDLETHELHYVSAGHPGTIWVHASGRVETLEATAPPLGIYEHIEVEQKTLSLSEGDRLFVYSDGLTEAKGEREELFGLERLVSLLDTSRSMSLSDTLATVIEAVRQWTNLEGFEDDVSCLALDVEAAG